MDFSLSCFHPKRYLKQRENHRRFPAHFPSTCPKCLHTQRHSPEGSCGCGFMCRPWALFEHTKKTQQNNTKINPRKPQNQKPELLDCAASTNSPTLFTVPHPKPRTPRPCPSGAQPHSTQSLWALTLMTLLLTLLMLQTPLPLLGMVVMRMGVLRSPRVTSAGGVGGMQDLCQPSRLSPAPGERLWPDCCTHPDQWWAPSSDIGEGLWGQPRDGEARPPSAPRLYPPSQGRALSTALLLEPRPPSVRNSPRSILSQACLQAGTDQTPCSNRNGTEQDRMDCPALGCQWGQSMNVGQRIGHGHRDGTWDGPWARMWQDTEDGHRLWGQTVSQY